MAWCRTRDKPRYLKQWWPCAWRIHTSPKLNILSLAHGPLTRYAKLRVAHAPGTFSPPPRASDPDMHHGTCVTHVPWCMPGSLTSGFLWSRWQGKRSRHFWCMRNLQFYASGKRPMAGSAFTDNDGQNQQWLYSMDPGYFTLAAIDLKP